HLDQCRGAGNRGDPALRPLQNPGRRGQRPRSRTRGRGADIVPTVREAAFRIFEHFGVDRLFGNPGSTELPMLKAMPFPYVMGLNEAVVVGMADGYARSRGKPALVNLHSSAGTGHSLGNLFTAFRNNTPLVVTAGQQARSILPHDPLLFEIGRASCRERGEESGD